MFVQFLSTNCRYAATILFQLDMICNIAIRKSVTHGMRGMFCVTNDHSLLVVSAGAGGGAGVLGVAAELVVD